MALLKHPSTYGTPTVHGSMNTVYIGKYCSIADSVEFDGGLQHNPLFVTTYPLWKLGAAENRSGMCKGDIHIENDVWIGKNALIMSGLRIGSGAIVGAHAVVTKDVAPYTVVGGVPAKVLRKRFTEEQVSALLDIAWWDWSESRILQNANLLLSPHIDRFIREHT